MIRKWILCYILIQCFHTGIAQTYNKAEVSYTLLEVFQLIEDKSIISINYDPELISNYLYQGMVDFNDIESTLQKSLKYTPFTYEIVNDIALIISTDVQEYNICGQIKSRRTDENLSYVNINATTINIGGETDLEGGFRFSLKAYKNQEIVISYIGYQSIRLIAEDFVDQECPIFYLEENVGILGTEIVITDYILTGISTGQEYGSTDINVDQVEEMTGFQEHDILKTVQLLPGIQSTDESASRLNIRGSTPDQNLIVWENIPLYDPGHLFGSISGVNPFVIDDVNVFTGVYHPRYESRVGGVIDLSMDDQIQNSFSGGIGTTLSEAHTYLDIPLISGKSSVTLAARHSINSIYNSDLLQNYTKKLFQETLIDTNSIINGSAGSDSDRFLKFYDVNAKFKYQITDKIKFSTSLFSSKNNYRFDTEYTFESIADNGEELIISVEESDVQKFETIAFSTKIDFQWTPYFETQVYYTDSDYKFNNQFSTLYTDRDVVSLSVNNAVIDRQFGIMNHWTDHEMIDFDLGYSYEFKDVSLVLNNDFFDYETVDSLKGHFHNVVGSVTFKMDKWMVSGGVRTTYYQEEDNIYLSPRLSIQYSLSPHVKIKASTGKFYQFISQVENLELGFINVLDAYWVLNDPDQDNQLNTTKFAIGAVYKKAGWLLDVEAYHHRIYNLSSLSSTFNSDIFFYDVGGSTSKGVDLLIKKNWGNFSSWINYSLSENRYLFPELSDESFLANNDQTHNFNWINNFHVNQFNFTASLQYKTGLPYSIPVPGELINDQDVYYYNYDFEEFNNNRLNDYSRLNLSVSHKSQLFKGKALSEISFTILNVFNRENVFSRSYNQNYSFDEPSPPDFYAVDKVLLQRSAQVMMRLEF